MSGGASRKRRWVSEPGAETADYLSTDNSFTGSQLTSFIGLWIYAVRYPTVFVSLYSADTPAVLKIQYSFSPDATFPTVDAEIEVIIALNELYSGAFPIKAPYCRVVVDYTLGYPGEGSFLRTVFSHKAIAQLQSGVGDVSLVSPTSYTYPVKVKALCEGSNITLTEDDQCVTISSAGAGATSLLVATDDIQAVEAPAGVYTLDVGHTTEGGANNTILGGKASYVGAIDATTTGCTIVGESFGNRSLIGIENGVAVGYRAGNRLGNLSIAIGHQAAEGSATPGDEQGDYCVAIGAGAAQYGQGTQSVAIGYESAQTGQGTYSVAVGYSAGNTTQADRCVAVGREAGNTSQSQGAVAIGSSCGVVSQGSSSIAIGYLAGQYNQGIQSVAIGGAAGQGLALSDNQREFSVSVGYRAGQVGQKDRTVAIGMLAGQTQQAQAATAVGYGAGQTNQETQTVAMGYLAGSVSQRAESVAIGYLCGQYQQGSCSVAIGCLCGQGTIDGLNSQGAESVAIGHEAGRLLQGTQSVAVGFEAGETNQGSTNVAIGYRAGQNNQTSGSANNGSIAIGSNSARNNQGQLSVAIGAESGRDNQGGQCVAVGRFAGTVSQKGYGVAIGDQAGKWDQGLFAVAIGQSAGYGEFAGVKVGSQANNAIAIGGEAGMYGQNSEAIAIGRNCAKGATDGSTPQPSKSVAIGAECATPGAVGRLAFGNAMEAVTAISAASHQHPTALINVEWNGVHYRLPALPNNATDIHTAMDPMAIGEIWYADATGFTTSGINTAGGILLAPPAMTLKTTSNLMSAAYFDEPVNGRLRYIGTTARTFHGAVSLSASCPNAGQALLFFVKKNGVTAAKSVYYFTSVTAGNNFTVAAHAVFDMAPNDYLEVWAENTTANNQLTVRNLNFVAVGDGSM